MITEECYTDFRPSWYLFPPILDSGTKTEILREVRASLSACEFFSGAFYLEIKLKNGNAHTINLSNRMPPDFPKFACRIMGFDPIEDYIEIMHGRSVVERPLVPQKERQILQYYNEK